MIVSFALTCFKLNILLIKKIKYFVLSSFHNDGHICSFYTLRIYSFLLNLKMLFSSVKKRLFSNLIKEGSNPINHIDRIVEPRQVFSVCIILTYMLRENFSKGIAQSQTCLTIEFLYSGVRKNNVFVGNIQYRFLELSISPTNQHGPFRYALFSLACFP